MKRQFPSIIVFITGLLFVVLFYGKILRSPNDYMFSNSGDGIKNYFTYAYYIKHNTDYLNFEGLNYPYGEHFLYTDCHPVLAATLKCMTSKFSFIETHAIGIVNFLMILSILLTFPICFFVLNELELDKRIGVLFSISIALLAPQLFRLTGHLSMSYSIALPLSWFIMLRFFRTEKKLLVVLLILNNLFWLFIHAYLGIIIISFLLLLLAFKMLIGKNDISKKNRYYWMVAAVVLPVVLFYTFALLTDMHVGRTSNPSGFFLYNAEFDDVLLPSFKPFRPLLDQLTGNIIKLEWEAFGYVGMFNSLLFIVLTIAIIISSFRKKTRHLLQGLFTYKNLNYSLLSALIILLFAMAFPFKQLPTLLELIPVFKQFRATGRFVWPFYFVFTAFAALTFQEIFYWIKSKRTGVYGILFLILVFGTLVWEAVPYHKNTSDSITQNPNLFNPERLPENYKRAIHSINPEDYQAIISLPYYYQGSESYGRPRDDTAVRNSILFSYHTGLPIVCANLTRTSIEESKKIVQLISPNYYEKPLIHDLAGEKPLLIVKSADKLTRYENLMLEKARSIYKSDKFELLKIDAKDLFSDDRNIIISQFNKVYPDLFKQGNFYVSDSSSVLYYNSYEDKISDTTFRGKGSFSSTKKGKNIFAEFLPNTFDRSKEYSVSMWMFNGEPDALNLWFRFIIEEYEKNTDTWYSTTFFPEHSEVISGDWSLVEGEFRVNNPANYVYIVSKGKENSKALLHADDLLIKESHIDVYQVENHDPFVLNYNNHNIGTQKFTYHKEEPGNAFFPQ